MLAAPMKKGKSMDWDEPLRTYLSQNYPVSEIERHNGSIQKLNTARERIINIKRIDEDTISHVRSYLRMLGSVQSRFPVTENDMKVNFTWFDSFKPQKKFTSQRLTSEKAAVLFNLAAMESYLGMQSDRTNPEGLKSACTHFQMSAGIFILLRDSYVPESVSGPITSDLTQEGLSMLISLMLAQAQACFFEKAVRNKMAASVLTKLAGQAQKYYTEALSHAASPALSSVLDKTWAAHLEFQSRCFAASSEYQFSKVQFENAEKTGEGYGLRIAWLDSANKKAGLAIETARNTGLPESMLGTVLNLQNILVKEYNKAVEDNNTIYMDRIPREDELGIIPAFSLAKPTPVPEDLYKPIIPRGENEEEDAVFKDLLPAEMQEAEAIFQSRVTALIQKSAQTVESSAENVRLRLAEANLPAAVEAGDSSTKGVPDATWKKIVEQVQNKGGVTSLNIALDRNSETAKIIGAKLADIEHQLRTEEANDAKFRQTWGERWTILPSAEVNKHIKKDVARYRGLLTEATQSDNTLRAKIREHTTILDTVNMPKEGIDLLMPDPGEVDEDAKVEQLRMELSLLLVKLGTSVQDAEKMQAELAETAMKDSIVPTLANSPFGVKEIVNNPTKLDSIVSEKISVHEDVVGHIQRMVEDQTATLSRVFDKNHEFMASRNQTDATRKRQEVLQQLEAGISVFNELSNHIEEGKKFYENLSNRVNQLETTVKDYAYSRKLQQDELEQELVKSFESGGGTTSGTVGLARQASVPAISEYVSSAGLNTSGTSNVAPYANTFSVSNSITPGFPVQSTPQQSYQPPQQSFQPPQQSYQPPQQSYQPPPQQTYTPAPQQTAPQTSQNQTSGMTSDEQLAFNLAQEQLVEQQRQLFMQVGNEGGSTGGLQNDDYSEQIEQMKSILGDGRKKKDLLPYIEGAGGDVSIAINHLMEDEANGRTNKSKKAAGGGGLFKRGASKEKKGKSNGSGNKGQLW